MEINQKINNQLKGIAIIGMMMLHFWYAGDLNWIRSENMYYSRIPISFWKTAGSFGNFCVPMFAFLTGYSLLAADGKWRNREYRIKKVVRFLFMYWFYMIFLLIIANTLGEETPNVITLLFNLFGFKTGVGCDYSNITFAWYVYFYVIAVLIYPILRWIIFKTNKLVAGLCIVGWLVISQFLKNLVGNGTDLFYFFDRMAILSHLLLGTVFAREKWFSRILDFIAIHRLKTIIVGIAVIILLFTSRIFFPIIYEYSAGMIYSLIICVLVLCINLRTNILWGKLLQLLEALGKRSMGMWFISSIFYLPSGLLQIYAFWPKYPILILCWILISTYIVTFIIDKVVKGGKTELESIKNKIC